ncbi:MAG: hypothetical protein AAGG56_18095 [Pseudomonadota bacterium]
MRKGHFIKIAASALLLASVTTEVAAKDWIEKFSYKPSGIDTEQIKVRANDSGYTTTTTTSKVFKLKTHAKAKSNKRIVGLKVEASTTANYLESSGGNWHYRYAYSEVGSGNSREKVWNHGYPLVLTEVEWFPRNPVEECNYNLARKMSQGWTKEQVLAQNWSLSTKAAFSASVVVTKRMHTTPNPNSLALGRRDIGSASTLYPVSVECMALPSLHNTIAPPEPKKMTISVPNNRRDDDRPSRKPSDKGRPDTRDGGGSPPARDDRGGSGTRDGSGNPPARDTGGGKPARDVSR